MPYDDDDDCTVKRTLQSGQSGSDLSMLLLVVPAESRDVGARRDTATGT